MDYHCRQNKKRLCGVCRRAKKYHYGPEPDLFQSVALAAKALALLRPHKPEDMIAVHMESVYEYGEISHKYWAHWNDGSKTEMTREEINQWATSKMASNTTDTGAVDASTS